MKNTETTHKTEEWLSTGLDIKGRSGELGVDEMGPWLFHVL